MEAYLDRMEENQFAVLIVERIEKEFILKKEDLPEGTKEGDYFDVTIEENELTSIVFNETLTKQKRENVQRLLQTLKTKNKE